MARTLATPDRRQPSTTHHRPRSLDLALRQRRARLKYALALLGLKQRQVAMRARIAETRLSDIIHGRVNPSLQEQARLARVLEQPPERLFGQPAAVVH